MPIVRSRSRDPPPNNLPRLKLDRLFVCAAYGSWQPLATLRRGPFAR
jgi:hypothetical protein